MLKHGDFPDKPEAPTLWCSTCALCASPVTRGALIAHRYSASQLQNLAVPQDFYSPLSLSLE